MVASRNLYADALELAATHRHSSYWFVVCGACEGNLLAEWITSRYIGKKITG